MPFSNVSQLLLRNTDYLKAKAPLLVNMPADNLTNELAEINPNGIVSIFNNNFQNHHLARTFSPNAQTQFGAYYHTTAIKHDLIIMQFPKSKKELFLNLAMLSSCCLDDTKVLIVGENKGGIKSLAKLANKQLTYCEKLDSARHCVLFEASIQPESNPFKLEDWFHYYSLNVANTEIKIAALPGVFSQEKLDVGTSVLLNNFHPEMTGKILDFGCGAGVIGAFYGMRNPALDITMADVSALALVSAQKTMELNNLCATVIATDSLSEISGHYHHIISNPPFHQGIKTHYAATESFLAGIAKHMANNAGVTIVANSFLKYPPIMEKHIGKTVKLHQEQGFSLYQAIMNKK
ncbi:methyltransferase [Thalassotalea fusca]